MIKIYREKELGQADHIWLRTRFHFSFAEYYNPERMHYGALRVINDDLIKGGNGFDTHPHQNMEIISYIIDGELTHQDSMGSKNTLGRGQVQYMSAGTGVYHSEFNLGKETARLLQIWILPDKNGYAPNYGDKAFQWDLRINKFLHLVSPEQGNAPIKIHQDANIYSVWLESGKNIEYDIKSGRQVYLVQIEGKSTINEQNIDERDGMEAFGEALSINAISDTHILLIDLKL